jgi:hypothetical protein
MLLTSVDRMRYYIGAGTPLTDNVENRRRLLTWITSISGRVEKYLNRVIESGTQPAEYFDVGYQRKEFFVKAPPISTITSVKVDSDGLFDGDETTLETNEYHIGVDSRSIVLLYPEREGLRGMQAVYVGGLAAHGTRSTFAATITGTWTVNKFALGATSGAFGTIKTVGASSLVIDNLYGVFVSGETLTMYDDESTASTPAATAVITSITAQSLAEAYPDIVSACEIQVRYMWKHKDDFENVGTQKDSTNRRSTVDHRTSVLQPETMSLLNPYRRMILG